MSWSDEMEQAVDAWVTAQRKLWDSVAESIQTAGAQQVATWWAAEGRRSVELWQASVHRALDAQAEWTRIWADAITQSPTTPEFFAEQVLRIQRLTAKWTEAQRDLYMRSVAQVKEQDALSVVGAFEKAADDAVRVWQEAVEQAAEAHRLWLKAMTSPATAPSADTT